MKSRYRKKNLEKKNFYHSHGSFVCHQHHSANNPFLQQMAQVKDCFPAIESTGDMASTAGTSFLEPSAVAYHAKPEVLIRARSGGPAAADAGEEECSFGRNSKSVPELKSNRFAYRRNRHFADGYSEKKCSESYKEQEPSHAQAAGEILLSLSRTHGGAWTEVQDERKREARPSVAEGRSEIIFIIQEVFG
jgi:hypothetical protein